MKKLIMVLSLIGGMGYAQYLGGVPASVTSAITNLQAEVALWENPTNGITQGAADARYPQFGAAVPVADVVIYEADGTITYITNLAETVSGLDVTADVAFSLTNSTAFIMRPITLDGHRLRIEGVNSWLFGQDVPITVLHTNADYTGNSIVHFQNSTNFYVNSLNVMGTISSPNVAYTNASVYPYGVIMDNGTAVCSNYVLDSCFFGLDYALDTTAYTNDGVKAFVDTKLLGNSALRNCTFYLNGVSSTNRLFTFGATHSVSNGGRLTVDSCRFIAPPNMLRLWTDGGLTNVDTYNSLVNVYVENDTYAYNDDFGYLSDTVAKSYARSGNLPWLDGSTKTEVENWVAIPPFNTLVSGGSIVQSSVPYYRLSYTNEAILNCTVAIPSGVSGNAKAKANIMLPASVNPALTSAVYKIEFRLGSYTGAGGYTMKYTTGYYTNTTATNLYLTVTQTLATVTNKIVLFGIHRKLDGEVNTTNATVNVYGTPEVLVY